MSGKRSEEEKMSARTEAAEMIQKLAEPCPAGDSVKMAMQRAWRRLDGWTFNRVRDVWHADKRIVVSGDELIQLRELTSQAKATRDDLESLYERISRIETALSISDQSFHRIAIDALREAMRPQMRAASRSGGVDSAMGGVEE